MKLDDMSTAAFGAFQFSGVRPERLPESEYTLVTLVLDKTQSVETFAQELFDIKKRVVEACARHPRAELLLLRVVEFNTRVTEVHGFMPLAQVDAAAYTVPVCEGRTALNDAVFSAIGATHAYAKALLDQDYRVNALVIVATDGANNVKGTSAADVRREIEATKRTERLDSIKSILVGVNTATYDSLLRNFATEVGIDEYVDVGEATPARLARLARFIEQSISTTSQALGTGGLSKPLVF